MTADLAVVSEWFSVTWITARVALITEPHVDPFLRANLWLVRGRERDLMIDTGNGIAPLRPLLERLSAGRRRDVVALATHAHEDHIGGLHEFERRLLHPKEAQAARDIGKGTPLVSSTWAAKLEADEEELILPPLLVTAVPSADFDPASFHIRSAEPTHLVQGGDLIDLGDHRVQVVDLPGHTPGSIGVWDEADDALYAGDAVYEGTLLDRLPESDVAAYVRTMRWLRDLPVGAVYPGHDAPFSRERLRKLADAYLRRRGSQTGG